MFRRKRLLDTVLTALVAGAAYAELEVSDVEADTAILDRHRVTVLGVNRKLREVLLRSSAAAFKGGTSSIE